MSDENLAIETHSEVSKVKQFVIDFCNNPQNEQFFAAFYGNVASVLLKKHGIEYKDKIDLFSLSSSIDCLVDHINLKNTDTVKIKSLLTNLKNSNANLQIPELAILENIDITRGEDCLRLCELCMSKFTMFNKSSQTLKTLTYHANKEFEWVLMSHFLKSRVSNLFNLFIFPEHDVAHTISELMLQRHKDLVKNNKTYNPYSIKLTRNIVKPQSRLANACTNGFLDLNIPLLIQKGDFSEEVSVLIVQEALQKLLFYLEDTDFKGLTTKITNMLESLDNKDTELPFKYVFSQNEWNTIFEGSRLIPLLNRRIVDNIANQLKIIFKDEIYIESLSDSEVLNYLTNSGLTKKGIITIAKNYYQILNYLNTNAMQFTASLIYSYNGINRSFEQMHEYIEH